MPEGPEVLYLKNNLLKKFIGLKLKSVNIQAGRYKTHGPLRCLIKNEIIFN